MAHSQRWVAIVTFFLSTSLQFGLATQNPPGRTRTNLAEGWRFWRSEVNPDGVIYDYRPDLENLTNVEVLKPWILPTANTFIVNAEDHYQPPSGSPTTVVEFAQPGFDDGSWKQVSVPHDWAIAGPFYLGDDADVPIPGGMGRLPIQGVGWYRRSISVTSADLQRSVFLEIDGAMSYSMVWVNGELVGGWPYGYNSYQLDVTSHLHAGDDNIVAIRLDNPLKSSRWYPGGGLYRNVWLVVVDKLHVDYSGTFITSRNVSDQAAALDLVVNIQNDGATEQIVNVVTEVFALDKDTLQPNGEKNAEFPEIRVSIPALSIQQVESNTTIQQPKLWGPQPDQEPNLYIAITRLTVDGQTMDTYQTQFGIRDFTYDPNQGLLVNGKLVRLQGTNNHHDLGAIGTAFSTPAALRKLKTLQDMGCNALRMSHNPPARELLDLTDQLGFLVMDEIFDMWEYNKTVDDFHLIFPEWHEADLRNMLRRDRNHPSIFAWSYGNEVYEQNTNASGAATSQMLKDIVYSEDHTRLATLSINSATPGTDFPAVPDIISLNYQGAGIRDTPAYSNSSGIKLPPMYPAYHATYPQKMILSSETAAALSSRGSFIFPVTELTSAPVNDSSGGDSTNLRVSAYELYSADFGASADRTFAFIDENPYVAGEFVWSGTDYLGEPLPYEAVRSSYCGIIDLAGFPKERFYLYQARWRPELPLAHILPHWNWPDRIGLVTPVHVFTSGDEAELFINGVSQGRQTKAQYSYRLRWDNVVYEPGQVDVVTYKNGQPWANSTVRTTGAASAVRLSAEQYSSPSTNSAAGTAADTAAGTTTDTLIYVTAEIEDAQGNVVPQANSSLTFSVDGPADLIATDNGDQADFTPFPSAVRNAYNGKALAIVRTRAGAGQIVIRAASEGLASGETVVTVDAGAGAGAPSAGWGQWE